MNTRRISAVLGAAGGLFGVVACVFAQSDASLGLRLRVPADPIGPIEPLRFELVVTNTGSTPIEGLAPWGDHSTVTVEFLAPGSQNWQALEVPRLNHSLLKTPTGGLSPLALAPGELRATDLTVVADPVESYRSGRIKYYFSEPGEYILRAGYRAAEKWTIRSDEASFRIEAYSGRDAAAYEWLKDRSIPHFMYDFSVYADNSAHETDDDARELIERFPRSRFAPWAKLFLARSYVFGLRRSKAVLDPPDPERAGELAAELVPSKDPDIRERAKAVLQEIDRRWPALSRENRDQSRRVDEARE